MCLFFLLNGFSAFSADYGLKDKVVLVTGGASGIGEATVKAFAAEGAIPVIIDRDESRGEKISQELSKDSKANQFIQADLTDEEACRRVIDQVIAKFHRIDVLVNNAGVNDGISLSHTPAEFAQSLQKNLFHYFTMAHFARPHLIAAQGSIVNVSSKVALTGQGGTSGYAASKGGVLGLTMEWAAELAKHHVRVNAVIPAEVMTPQYEKWLSSLGSGRYGAIKDIENRIPLGGRMTTAEEIADQIVFLTSMRATHITGQGQIVDGGYIKLDRAIQGVPAL